MCRGRQSGYAFPGSPLVTGRPGKRCCCYWNKGGLEPPCLGACQGKEEGGEGGPNPSPPGPLRSPTWPFDPDWTVRDFILGGSKITADSDYSHEIKRCLLLGRKAMTNIDSILKSRDITLLTKVRPVKAMVFPVVVYGCES